MNALEWNGNHETSSLHKEEVVLQACQIKEWHHIIFVNADSSSSIIRQTWKVLFSYHMVRHQFPFISGASSACLSRSPASSTVGNLQKLRKCDRKSNISTPWLTYSRCTFQSHLTFVYITNQRKLKLCPCTEKIVMCHHFQTSSAIFVCKVKPSERSRFSNCLWNTDSNHDRKHYCVCITITFWKCFNTNCRSCTGSQWPRIQEGHHKFFGNIFFSPQSAGNSQTCTLL